ncbi:MAG: zinc dependent phospholipase C family protein [Lachnospirales bacterium]
MPGFITHYICGQSILKNTTSNVKDIIKKYEGIYNIGTQGPDMFFYYIPGHFKKSTQFLGLKMHKSNTQLFAESLIKHTQELNEEDKEIAIAYVAGYLTHYALDANTHPYIYYKTGFRKKGDCSPKYSLYHRKFETSIDILLLKLLNGKKTSKRKMWEVLKSEFREYDVISKLLVKAIEESHGRVISESSMRSCIKYMVNLNRFLNMKPGSSEMVPELLEDLTIGECRYNELLNLQYFRDNLDYFNLDKKTWYNPWDDSVEYNSSFIDLYNEGIKESKSFVEASFECIYNNMTTEEFVSYVGNKSLSSGLDCNMDLDWKFHDIIFVNN